MKDTDVHNGAFGADKFAFKKLREVKWNLGAPALYEFAILKPMRQRSLPKAR